MGGREKQRGPVIGRHGALNRADGTRQSARALEAPGDHIETPGEGFHGARPEREPVALPHGTVICTQPVHAELVALLNACSR